MFKDAISSLMLISRVPLGLLKVKCCDFSRAVIHFPLAGYFAFAFWYITYRLSHAVFNDSLVPVCLSMVVVYYLFNLFHFDGFLDSLDGLLSQKPKEDVLRIMKLGNIGPTALFFGVIYLGLKVYLAVKLNVLVMLPVFVVARWGMSFAACVSKPAADTGLGNTITYGKPAFLACSTLYLAFLLPACRVYMIGILLAATAVFDFIIVKSIENRIGGLTGDNFGLINEMNELVLMLIAFSIG